LMSSFGGFHTSNYAVGNPYNTAHVPNNILEYSDRKTFSERLVNTLFTWYWDIGNELFFFPNQNQLKDEFFGPGYPSVQELRKSASLMLVNQHFSLNYPRPLVPAFVEVGGMHVKPVEKSTMPKDMKKWLDDAKDGVIYFSMGSNLRAEFMPEMARRNFLAAFAELKQKIIWKWETDTLPGKPDNVMLTKWAPQMEILCELLYFMLM
jgi:UDP:flavonoid glycosyltransferase YjiC (YdhE family)